MTGVRYGQWTTLGESVRVGKTTVYKTLCRCDCGTEKTVVSVTLRNGTSRNYGCIRKGAEFAAKAKISSTQHGMYGTPEYQVWARMVDVCENPKSKDYKNYGGRGIKLSSEWRHDPGKFLIDMGKRPGPEYSIERVDVNGDYCKVNCKWATDKEQANNMRSNRLITYRGKTKTLAQWAETLNTNYHLLWNRLVNNTFEQAMEKYYHDCA